MPSVEPTAAPVEQLVSKPLVGGFITEKGNGLFIPPLVLNATAYQNSATWVTGVNVTRAQLVLNSTPTVGLCTPFYLSLCTKNSPQYRSPLASTNVTRVSDAVNGTSYKIGNPAVLIKNIQVRNPNVGLVTWVNNRLCFLSRSAGTTQIAYSLAGSDKVFISNVTVSNNPRPIDALWIARSDFDCGDRTMTSTAGVLLSPESSTALFNVNQYRAPAGCSDSNMTPSLKAKGNPILLQAYAGAVDCRPVVNIATQGVWVSSNTSVASILPNGTLLPNNPGIVTIYFFMTPALAFGPAPVISPNILSASVNSFEPKSNQTYDLGRMLSMSTAMSFRVE